MSFGLADAARCMRRVGRKAHDCRYEPARIEKRALNPGVGQRDSGVRDERWRVQVKQLSIALVEQSTDRLRPLPPLHVVRYNTVVVLVELREKQQGV